MASVHRQQTVHVSWAYLTDELFKDRRQWRGNASVAAMADADVESMKMRLAAWLRRNSKLFAWNAFAFLLIFAALGLSASYVRNSVLWLSLNAGGGVALVVSVVYVLLVVLALPALVRDHFRGHFGVLAGGLIGFAAGASALLAYIFAGVSFAMASLGWVSYASTKAPDDMIVDLSETYMWHVYDLIPAIEVNRSLGQETPRIVLESVSNNGMADHKGLVLVAFRIIVVMVLFRTVLRLFQSSHQDDRHDRAPVKV